MLSKNATLINVVTCRYKGKPLVKTIMPLQKKYVGGVIPPEMVKNWLIDKNVPSQIAEKLINGEIKRTEFRVGDVAVVRGKAIPYSKLKEGVCVHDVFVNCANEVMEKGHNACKAEKI